MSKKNTTTEMLNLKEEIDEVTVQLCPDGTKYVSSTFDLEETWGQYKVEVYYGNVLIGKRDFVMVQ